MKDFIDRFDPTVNKTVSELSNMLSNRSQRWRQREGGLGLVDKRGNLGSASNQDKEVVKRLSSLQILHNIVWEIDLVSMTMFQPRPRGAQDDGEENYYRITYPLPPRKEPSERVKKALRGCHPPRPVPTLAEYDRILLQGRRAAGIEDREDDTVDGTHSDENVGSPTLEPSIWESLTGTVAGDAATERTPLQDNVANPSTVPVLPFSVYGGGEQLDPASSSGKRKAREFEDDDIALPAVRTPVDRLSSGSCSLSLCDSHRSAAAAPDPTMSIRQIMFKPCRSQMILLALSRRLAQTYLGRLRAQKAVL